MFNRCSRAAGGVAVWGGRRSLRTMAIVIPVTPMFFWAPPYSVLVSTNPPTIGLFVGDIRR